MVSPCLDRGLREGSLDHLGMELPLTFLPSFRAPGGEVGPCLSVTLPPPGPAQPWQQLNKYLWQEGEATGGV